MAICDERLRERRSGAPNERQDCLSASTSIPLGGHVRDLDQSS